jgi:hypothetical protein
MTEKYNLGPLVVDSIECINLAHRKDRRQAIRKLSKKKHFPVHMNTRKGNEKDPERDRFEAHMSVIKQAADKWRVFVKSHEMQDKEDNNNDKTKAILILEDDAHVLSKSLFLPGAPPSDWQMIYLGGNVQKMVKDEDPIWKQVCCTMTHAYIVRSTLFQTILDKSKDAIGKVSLEKFYCQGIHPNHPTYIVTPEYVIQKNGYSDIKKRYLSYGQQSTQFLTDDEKMLVKNIDSVKMVKSDEGGYKMDLQNFQDDDLPLVTLLTPTTNKKEFFSFVIRNFYLLQYPTNKIRWVIADDGDNDQKVAELVPGDDPRIKYVNCKMDAKTHLSLAKKLNLCVAYAEQETDYFLVFADDCYYPPHSVLSRIRTLLTYSASRSDGDRKQCVGCIEFGLFDFEKNESYVSHFDDVRGNQTILTVPSLGFSKQFYENRRFDETAVAFPSFQFCAGRFQEVIQIPYEFIYIQLHSSKVASDIKYDDGMNQKDKHKAKKSQRIKPMHKSENKFSFFDTWDRDTREFVLLIKETV